MKKYFTKLLFIFLSLPFLAKADEFKNPAEGFLMDLTKLGKTNTFGDLLLYFVQILLGVVGILSMAFIIIGGFQYVTSRGDQEQAEAGKKTLSNAIIGLVIVILSYTVIAVVVNALKGRV